MTLPVFTHGSSAYKYRPLKEGDYGWDVYALQTALNGMGFRITESAVFDENTLAAVQVFQKRRNLAADGIAGVLTQNECVRVIAPVATKVYGLPLNLLKGQIEKESGNWLGNHSARYGDGVSKPYTWDLGVTQRNSGLHSFADAYDTYNSIFFLAKTIRTRYDQYRATGKVSNQRCWELAAGSWNRPAFTAYLAGRPVGESKKPTATELEWIEGYIDRVTVYVTKWPTH